MITVLTKRYGKISAGTSINEGGKNKSALALRPFSYGRYDIFKNKDNYNKKYNQKGRKKSSTGLILTLKLLCLSLMLF